jgi:hypothetical protein
MNIAASTAWQFLWRMQLQIQYTPGKVRPHLRVPEEIREFHAQEAAGCHHEGGKSHQVLARGLYTLWALLRAKIIMIKNKEFAKSTYRVCMRSHLMSLHCSYRFCCFSLKVQ